jgi:hypothetical protein
MEASGYRFISGSGMAAALASGATEKTTVEERANAAQGSAKKRTTKST